MSVRTRLHEEQGVALIFALLAVVILAGLAGVFMSRSITETRASGLARDFERAVHIAEAGADLQVSELNRNDDHVTENAAEVEVEFDPDDVDDEQAWVLGLVDEMRGSDAWVRQGTAEGFAVRPRDADTGEPLDVIYAAGAVPSFQADVNRTRVLKLQIAQDHWRPQFALLTGADLKFGGNAAVLAPDCDTTTPEQAAKTCIADVHVMGDLTNPGNASKIEGTVTVADGTCPSSLDATGGCQDQGVLERGIPEFSARDFYRPRFDDDDEPDGSWLNTDPEGQKMGWFDLCPDGKVRLPDPGGQPCQGPVEWPSDEDDSSRFRGWDWRPAQNTWRSVDLGAGVFYVYHADADVTGSDGDQARAVTIIVEGDPAKTNKSGSLAIGGNARLQAGMEDVLFVTDRDLRMKGTASGGTGDACDAPDNTYSGFIGVHEQLDVSGTVELRGAIVARDHEDLHNLVKRNTAGVNGTMCLQYDPQLVVDLSGIWVVTYWNEL